MSISGFDFLINGVGYMAAEDSEGDHYILNGEPLRPPNAVTVQGENSQKFQVRPDILLWSLTDWSGGEGQQKFDVRSPNRWRVLEGVRVFEKPGTVTPGFFLEETKDDGGTNDFAVDGQMGIADGELVLIDNGSDNVYTWNTTKWSAATNLTGSAGVGVITLVAGDSTNFYFAEQNTDNIFYWPVTGSTATNLNADTMANGYWHLFALDSYIYAVSPLLGQVWEIPKSGAAETLIDSFDIFLDLSNPPITSVNGKIYIALSDLGQKSVIREITPSSAAGTGFGAEIAVFSGFRINALWSHSGVLFMGGIEGTNSDKTSIMYLSLDGTYGSLGRLRDGFIGHPINAQWNSTMLSHYFALMDNASNPNVTRVFEIDAVSGGMACVAYTEDNTLNSLSCMAVYDSDIFLSGFIAGPADRVLRAREDQYTISSNTVSPWHDFDLADEKILSSLTLSCEALLADWTVYVDYAIDGSTSWTNVITYTTDGGKGTRTLVSTDSSTIKFRTLSLRLRMEYTGAGVPSTAPVVLGIEARAMVIQPVNTWQLLLDLADPKSGPQGFSGATKITNILNAAAAKNVIAFKDGYRSHEPGANTEYDVIIDSFQLNLSTPGEGYIAVTLKEPS